MSSSPTLDDKRPTTAQFPPYLKGKRGTPLYGVMIVLYFDLLHLVCVAFVKCKYGLAATR